MKPLELPPTIRTARPDEVTNPNAEILKRLKAREEATIVEGYTLQPNPEAGAPFRFFSEINIDNSRLWDLFGALVRTLPADVCLIYGHIDDEPVYGRYMAKEEVLQKLAPYQLELTQDGFLEFGVIYQDNEQLQEVFIKRAKYVQYWGVDEAPFLGVMQEAGLIQVEGLNFIDDFPLATEPLKVHRPEAGETDEVLKSLEARFGFGV
ncbi:MAG TPA: hypothetical protein VGE66_09300 [Chitinophagaceae bacterium]